MKEKIKRKTTKSQSIIRNLSMENKNLEKGITLIALVITIIVLLILAGVAIVTLTGENGILTQARSAKLETEVAKEIEQIKLAVMACRANTEYDEITIERLKEELKSYDDISQVEGINSLPTDAKQVAKTNPKFNIAKLFMPVSYAITEKFEYAKVTYTSGRSYGVKLVASNVGTVYEFPEVKPFDAEEWDKTALNEEYFYWGSDDPNSEDYGTVVGYTEEITNYSLLRFPSRCNKIDLGKYSTTTSTDPYSGSSMVSRTWYGGETRAYTNNIIKVEIPETVKTIADESFGCTTRDSFKGLKEIVIEGGLEYIGRAAFYNCSRLKNVTIRGDVGSIGEDAFKDLTSLTNVTIGESSGDVNAKSIGAYAFDGCKNLVNLNIKCDEIGLYAFQNCDSLKSVSITSNTIGDGAFYLDENLSDVILNQGLNTIGSKAFAYCPIEEITIPESVTSIGNLAFSCLVGSQYKSSPYLESFYIKEGSKLVITPSTWGVPEDAVKYY